jgi:integrase
VKSKPISGHFDGGNGRGLSRLTAKRVDAWLKSGKGPLKKLSDGGGLSLVRLPSGSATWQLKYRVKQGDDWKERTYSVGPINGTGLAAAREERDRVRQLVKSGRDPVQARRLDRAEEVASSGELFVDLLRIWLKKEKPGWSAIHYDKSSKALARHVVPMLGKLPVRDITPSMVSSVIETVQSGGRRETASKILQHVRAIFRLAAAKGLRDDNPAEPAIEILAKAKQVRHRPALLNFAGLGDVLRAGELARMSPEVRLCHRLIAFTSVRVSNGVAIRWEELNLEARPSIWIIPRSKMKVRGRAHDHKIILPNQIAAELRAWHALQGFPTKGWVFPGSQGREHLTRESIEKALHSMGFKDKHTCHGWRASFSTLSKDNGFDKQVVDLALDHVHDNEVARAYDRGERLQMRTELAMWWGKQLVQAQSGGEVLAFSKDRARIAARR